MIVAGPHARLHDNQALLAQAQPGATAPPDPAPAGHERPLNQRTFGGDRVSISAAARAVLEREVAGATDDQAPTRQPGADPRPADAARPGAEAETEAEAGTTAEADTETAAETARPRGADGEPLDEQDLRDLRRLDQRDREVRAHEQAHVAAGGPHVRGAPSYTYQRGPDGQRYAVGGEVPIDTGSENDPQATIDKMRQVRRAALAPAEPSSADRSIAAQAAALEAQAQLELRAAQRSGEADAAGSDRSTASADDEALDGGGDAAEAEDTVRPDADRPSVARLDVVA